MSVVYYILALLGGLSAYVTNQNQKARRQIRWMVWGEFIGIAPFLVFSVLPPLFHLPIVIDISLVGILWCAIPTTFAIAVLHERLFDIDVIIRKTLVYTFLTTTLGAVYLGSVYFLQDLFTGSISQNRPGVAIVITTLMIAALFNPLRKWIQAEIDRRFYRRKYDSDRMFRIFADSIRDDVEIDRLSDHLLSVVEQALQPTAVSLIIRNHLTSTSDSQKTEQASMD